MKVSDLLRGEANLLGCSEKDLWEGIVGLHKKEEVEFSPHPQKGFIISIVPQSEGDQCVDCMDAEIDYGNPERWILGDTEVFALHYNRCSEGTGTRYWFAHKIGTRCVKVEQSDNPFRSAKKELAIHMVAAPHFGALSFAIEITNPAGYWDGKGNSFCGFEGHCILRPNCGPDERSKQIMGDDRSWGLLAPVAEISNRKAVDDTPWPERWIAHFKHHEPVLCAPGGSR